MGGAHIGQASQRVCEACNAGNVGCGGQRSKDGPGTASSGLQCDAQCAGIGQERLGLCQPPESRSVGGSGYTDTYLCTGAPADAMAAATRGRQTRPSVVSLVQATLESPINAVASALVAPVQPVLLFWGCPTCINSMSYRRVPLGRLLCALQMPNTCPRGTATRPLSQSRPPPGAPGDGGAGCCTAYAPYLFHCVGCNGAANSAQELRQGRLARPTWGKRVTGTIVLKAVHQPAHSAGRVERLYSARACD